MTPWSISSWTEATSSRSPYSSTTLSRNSITSGKLCPVSTCMIGNGTGAGANALRASCSISTESLPPEKSITGCSNSAATSRMMNIDSASSVSRSPSSTEVGRTFVVSSISAPTSSTIWGRHHRPHRARPVAPHRGKARLVDAALGLGDAGPAAVAKVAARAHRLRAVRAADRGVAAIVERVVREAVLMDVVPDVSLGPVGQRVQLPEAELLVPGELRGPGSGAGIRSADAGDPAVYG